MTSKQRHDHLVLMLTLVVFVTPAWADEKKPEENAALVYWQAFAQLPQLDTAQEELLSRASVAPLDDLTRQLAAADGALNAFHRAAALPYCEYTILPNGFRLSSQLESRGQSIGLTIGAPTHDD